MIDLAYSLTPILVIYPSRRRTSRSAIRGCPSSSSVNISPASRSSTPQCFNSGESDSDSEPSSSSATILHETTVSSWCLFSLSPAHSPSPVLWHGTDCGLTFELHQHCLLLKIGLRLICFCSRIMYCHLNQLNLSGVCCTAPLWWLHGHVMAPYKLSHYYYYYYYYYYCVIWQPPWWLPFIQLHDLQGFRIVNEHCTVVQEWDFQPNSKLYKIYPSVHCIAPLSSQFSWRDQVDYNHLRIGHSYPTHSYLLNKDPQPLCIPGHSPFSIEHILTECIDFQPIRVNYYSTSDISQLFHKVHPSSILQYMKGIYLYKKL